MKERLQSLFTKLLDSDLNFRERSFLLLTIIAEIAVTLVMIGDILTRENPIEIIVLFLIVLVSPFFTWYSLKKHRLGFGAGMIATGVVFVVLPVTFFFGGGLSGGSNIWFAFAYLYIGLILAGWFRILMLSLLTLLVIVEYVTAYFYPELIVGHSRSMWFADSVISVLLVGFVVYILVWFQGKLWAGENTRALKQAEKIEELNQAQNRFFTSMSHEIRTPINTIIGLNEMILRSDVSEEVAEDAVNIQSASRILLSLINDILDMSKIESGKMEIVNAPYSVEKMLSDIMGMIRARANAKGLSFHMDVDPTLPAQLSSDEVRIKQILINLLNNAVKYTQEGSVILSVHCSKTEHGKALVTYSVEDTGMGIRKESIPHLFDAFRRENIDKNRFIEGTGLGLSIVKQLVTLLGGEVSVNSVYSQGSTFIVTIEQEIADENVIGQFDPEKLHDSQVRERYHQSFEAPEAKVLIVDDNAANLLVAEKLLRDTKVQVTTAESAKECLVKTGETHFDAIFMDRLMPQMDGIECLHAIREQVGGLCKDTPVIALTANAGSENTALYRREGFDSYLLKPVEGPMLEAALYSVLPDDLVSAKAGEDEHFASDKVLREMRRKVPILITTDSVSDLPRELAVSKKIPVMPYRVFTENGVFSDGIEAEGDAIIRHMQNPDTNARSSAPDVEEYEKFFAKQLAGAQHIIHIAMARHSSKGFENASEAALAFYNVHVVDSGHLSSGMGLLALYAKELAESGTADPEEILRLLEIHKEKIETSFIVDNTEFLYRGGKLSERAYELCNAFMLHPVIRMKQSAMKIGSIIIGGRERTVNTYIRKALRQPGTIDTSVLFITYVGMRRSDIERVKEEVSSVVKFDKIYLQKASPAISINCGAGTFGLLFARK